ncbi:hypothetical protein LIER_43216 [Lithospermum erythrorhizon]|uniref:Uncharacterized protein n=1 Tax=Lithospermum erythrorhizon TaxID=34254 RepID=A0AAV3PSE4_LITER
MADDDDAKNNHPSLPANYVSLAHLQQQWLKRKQKQEQEAAARQKDLEIQKPQEFVADEQKIQFKQHQKQGNYVEKLNIGSKNSRNLEKLNVGSVQESDKNQFQHQKQGDYGKNIRNLEKMNLGSKNNSNIEKSNVGSVQNCDKERRQFQADQKQGNYGKNKKNIEKLNLGSVKYKRNVEKLSLGRIQDSDQHNRECKHDQELEGYVKDNRNGHKKSLLYGRNNEKGVYKDKGEGKIGEVGEREFDSVLHWREESGDFGRCDGEFRRNFGGGGACFEVDMYSLVEVKEDEFVEVKKRDDGFRGGLTGNGSDLRAHYGVSENLGKRKTTVETETCLERGKEVGDEPMKVGHRKKGSFRASRWNQGSLVENCGGSCNVTKGEGVEETGNVLELKENESVSDMGVAIDVKNVEQRRRKGYRNTWSKKDVSKGKSRNGRGMTEENIGQLDFEKENGEEKGKEGNGDNIGDGESVVEEVVQLKEPNRKSVSMERRNVKGRVMERARGGYEKWTVKEVRKGASIIKNTIGEKSTINESIEKIAVVESEVIAKADLYSNGSQRNYCGNMVNIECRENTMEKIENRVRDKNRGIWRKNVQYNWNRRFQDARFGYNWNQRFQDARFADKQRNSGLVWVKKEDIAGATIST